MAIFIPAAATSQVTAATAIDGAWPSPSAEDAVHGHRVRPSPFPAARLSRSDSNEDIQKFKGPKTQVIDLGGHFVMPGFNDAHVHLGSGGFEKLNVDLVGSKSLDDMKQRIAARVKTAASGRMDCWPWLGPYAVGGTENADAGGH